MAAHSEERLARMGARAELVWKGKQCLLQDMCGIAGKVEFLKGWSGDKLHLYSETIPLGPERKLLGSEIVPVQS